MKISDKRFWEVFFTKLRFNLHSEASKTYLGYLWWLFEPALFVLTLYLVFGVFLHSRTEDLLVFLVCGIIPFMWFSRSISNASMSIVSGKGLIAQVALPKIFFPLLVVCQDAVKQAVVFVAMFGFLLFMHHTPTLHWLGLVPIVLVQFVLISSIALLAASITPLFPDFKFLLATGLRMLFWLSGIFYSYEDVILPEHRSLFLLNPMANLVKNYREVILHQQFPDFVALALIAGFSFILIAVMHGVLKRFDTSYARLVIQ